MRGLDRDKSKRFATAREFAIALERTVHPALASDIGDWVEGIAGTVLNERAVRIAEIESVTDSVPAIGLTEVMSGLDSSSAVPSAPTSGMIGGSSSQVSSISVAASDDHPFARPRRRGFMVAVAAAAGVGVLLAVVLVVSFSGRKTTAGTGTSSASLTAPPERPALSASPPPTTPAIETAQPTATATATAAATTKKWVAPPNNKPDNKPDDCKIPYTLGPNGEKIYKRHCF
jgi:hypothetical protein